MEPEMTALPTVEGREKEVFPTPSNLVEPKEEPLDCLYEDQPIDELPLRRTPSDLVEPKEEPLDCLHEDQPSNELPLRRTPSDLVEPKEEPLDILQEDPPSEDTAIFDRYYSTIRARFDDQFPDETDSFKKKMAKEEKEWKDMNEEERDFYRTDRDVMGFGKFWAYVGRLTSWDEAVRAKMKKKCMRAWIKKTDEDRKNTLEKIAIKAKEESTSGDEGDTVHFQAQSPRRSAGADIHSGGEKEGDGCGPMIEPVDTQEIHDDPHEIGAAPHQILTTPYNSPIRMPPENLSSPRANPRAISKHIAAKNLFSPHTSPRVRPDPARSTFQPTFRNNGREFVNIVEELMHRSNLDFFVEESGRVVIRPDINMETLIYQAFNFMYQDQRKTGLKLSDIYDYIEQRDEYFAAQQKKADWKRKAYKSLTTTDYIHIEEQCDDADTLYYLNKTDYEYKMGEGGEVQVRFRGETAYQIWKREEDIVDAEKSEDVVARTPSRRHRRLPATIDDVDVMAQITGSISIQKDDELSKKLHEEEVEEKEEEGESRVSLLNAIDFADSTPNRRRSHNHRIIASSTTDTPRYAIRRTGQRVDDADSVGDEGKWEKKMSEVIGDEEKEEEGEPMGSLEDSIDIPPVYVAPMPTSPPTEDHNMLIDDEQGVQIDDGEDSVAIQDEPMEEEEDRVNIKDGDEEGRPAEAADLLDTPAAAAPRTPIIVLSRVIKDEIKHAEDEEYRKSLYKVEVVKKNEEKEEDGEKMDSTPNEIEAEIEDENRVKIDDGDEMSTSSIVVKAREEQIDDFADFPNDWPSEDEEMDHREHDNMGSFAGLPDEQEAAPDDQAVTKQPGAAEEDESFLVDTPLVSSERRRPSAAALRVTDAAKRLIREMGVVDFSGDAVKRAVPTAQESTVADTLRVTDAAKRLIREMGVVDFSVDGVNRAVTAAQDSTVAKGRPGRRSAAKALNYAESMEDSDEETAMNWMTPKSVKKVQKRRSSLDGAPSPAKLFKPSDTEIKCPKCEYRSNSANGWLRHFKRMHSTTALVAGFALRCECGHESFSDGHSYVCDIANFTVVPSANGPSPSGRTRTSDTYAKKAKRNDTVLKCPQCGFRSDSVGSWVKHLLTKHATTPKLAGFALRCECGHEAFSEKHSYTCDIAQFTVVRAADGLIKTTPRECLICKKISPTTIWGYVRHLKEHHDSSLAKNGIYLKCVCGVTVEGDNRVLRKHYKECNRREFTIHKLDEAGSTEEEM